MAQQTTSKDTKPKLIHIMKLLVRLGPKQVNDEIQLALAQLKTKGIAAGIATALIVVGLVFVMFLAVALIVAAIAALSLVLELWAAALVVAGGFLVIAMIFALIGAVRLRSTLPLVPQDAIRGLRLDLGAIQQGSDFDPKSLDREDERRRRSREEAEKHDEQMQKSGVSQPTPTKPDYSELLRRTTQRREHIAGLKDSLQQRFSAQQPPAGPGSLTVEAAEPQGADSAESDESQAAATEHAPRRWGSWAVAAGSVAAGAAFVRELMKQK